MYFLKKILAGSFVLLASTAIFYILINDQSMKDDILRTTLETLGQRVLAMVPEGANKAELQHKVNEFINRAGNNELSRQQIQSTAASILNLSLDENQATPEVIKAVMEAHLDTIPLPPPRARIDPDHPLKKRELAVQLKQMMTLQDEMKRMSFEDSPALRISNNVVFSADSGLQVWLSPDLMEQHLFLGNPDFLKKLKQLHKQDIVRYYNFNQLNSLELAGLKFAAPYLSPEDNYDIKLYLKQHPSFKDSMQSDRSVLHPDSVHTVIEFFRAAAREIRAMQIKKSKKD